MPVSLDAATVRVPCSTSNLGAGFDCIGLALNRFLEARFHPGGDGLDIVRRGTIGDLQVPASEDLFVRTFVHELERAGVPRVRGRLVLDSTIPIARGLGSSAAATVGALLLARAVLRRDIDRADVLHEAEAIEGHPDNSAPALFGGLVAVAHGHAGASRVLRLPLAPALGFAWAAPHAEVPTALARKALPASVPHAAATRALGRVAALVHGLATGDAELLRAGFADELHVPYRLPLIPRAGAAFDAATHAGAYAVTISGSGSGLIAVTAKENAQRVADAMAAALRGKGEPPCVAFAAQPVDAATIENETCSIKSI